MATGSPKGLISKQWHLSSLSRQDAPVQINLPTDRDELSVQADIAVVLRFEVAMKRPGHGLLKRMIRLVETAHTDIVVDGKARRALLLHCGAEYHIALQILQSPHLDRSTTYAAEWLGISMPGCLPMRIQVSAVGIPERLTSFWGHTS